MSLCLTYSQSLYKEPLALYKKKISDFENGFFSPTVVCIRNQPSVVFVNLNGSG